MSYSQLIARIYETRLTGSELEWGNSAAHRFKLQALVAPRGDMILAICFWVPNILPRVLISLLTKRKPTKFLRYFCTLKRKFLAKKWGYRWELVGVFGSNVPHSSADWSLNFSCWCAQRKKSVLRKTEALWGKNRPKLAQIRYKHNANFALTQLQTC